MFTASPASDAELAGTVSSSANKRTASDPRSELLRQSGVARSLGSPFVGAVLAAAYRQLWRAPQLDATIATWPLNPAASAMALRLNAGLHALARRGTFKDLSALYAREHDEFDRAVGEALQHGAATLLVWMSYPTQTNEVRRSSAFMAALLVLADQHRMPFELLEVGASAGLNLLLDRYAHDLGGTHCGQGDSSLHLKPQWGGTPPPEAEVHISSAQGVDLRPLHLDDPYTRERLMSYIWAGDEDRTESLRQAMAIADKAIPSLDRESAAPWLAEKLQQPQVAGTMRIVQHSMVLQYLPGDELRAVLNAIYKAGSQATPERPLARVGLEWNRDRTRVLLCMTQWAGGADDGRRNVLAACHPYGAAIEWYGPGHTHAPA